MMRRVIYQHTRGPWKGVHQIIALELRDTPQGVGRLGYLHTREIRALEPGPMPDRLAAIPMTPDGRQSKGMRLKSTDRYVLYQEVPA